MLPLHYQHNPTKQLSAHLLPVARRHGAPVDLQLLLAESVPPGPDRLNAPLLAAIVADGDAAHVAAQRVLLAIDPAVSARALGTSVCCREGMDAAREWAELPSTQVMRTTETCVSLKRFLPGRLCFGLLRVAAQLDGLSLHVTKTPRKGKAGCPRCDVLLATMNQSPTNAIFPACHAVGHHHQLMSCGGSAVKL